MAQVKPKLEDLWTTTHIGRRLGITRQGAAWLPQANKNFPAPIGKLGLYVLWWRPEVEAWIKTNRPGIESPKRAAAARASRKGAVTSVDKARNRRARSK